MKKIFASLITLISIYSVAFGQLAKNKVSITPVIKLPETATVSTTTLSNYFTEKYPSDTDRIKAIFTWEATNISYDVDNMYMLTYGEGKEEKINKALTTRAAVCEGYAELFNEICNKSGIRSMVIEGYTKQKGMVDYIPHAWVAANIQNSWYLFDPTWSSGYLNNGKYVSSFSYRFYKVKPEELIKTHMPFDPLYQFLKHPVSTKNFYEGNFTNNTQATLFNFEDTLAYQARLSEVDKLKNTSRRIEANGVRSSMILQMLQYLKNKELNIYATMINSASVKANEGVNSYNRYVEYKNKQFTPKKEDPDIEQMLTDVQARIDSVNQMIAGITTEDASYKLSISQMQTQIMELQKMVNEEKLFVAKYIKTKKMFRPMLFKKFG